MGFKLWHAGKPLLERYKRFYMFLSTKYMIFYFIYNNNFFKKLQRRVNGVQTMACWKTIARAEYNPFLRRFGAKYMLRFLYMIRVHFYLILHVIKLNTYMKGFDCIYYALTYTIFYK